MRRGCGAIKPYGISCRSDALLPHLIRIPFDKLSVKYYVVSMKLWKAASAMGKKGGKARAAKYDHKTLSEWAKKGGRPRKDARKSAPKGGKEGRK